MRRLFLFLITAGFAFTSSRAAPLDRSDPAAWDLWRCGPITFPTAMSPQVPEADPRGVIGFGRAGSNLVIVMPDRPDDSYDGRALAAMARMIHQKTPRGRIVPAGALAPADQTAQWIVLGTPATNSVARAAAKIVPAGGYRVLAQPDPGHPGRRIVYALGATPATAWSAAAILAYGIHPDAAGLAPSSGWPYPLPAGTYWASFDASYEPGLATVITPPEAKQPAAPPQIPFGVRIWGSPMPDLPSFKRLVLMLHGLGINTIAVQGGGWPDLPDAGRVYHEAVDYAWRWGIATILYVGNEMAAHRPAALTDRHRAVVLATKDLPGLLQWHLYNQLAADLTPAEARTVQEEFAWIRSVSDKPIGVEVVWGHDTARIPAAKVKLIQQLKDWGMTVVASDDAPIGGWSQHHRMDIWEPRFRELARFGLPEEAVLQAHVPFLAPAIPTPAELRSQFWWATAGGARGYLFETAYLFSSLSMRGILCWDLRHATDARYGAIRSLAQTERAIEPMLVNSRPEPEGAEAAAGFKVSPAGAVAIRLRRSAQGAAWLLAINPRLDAPASATIEVPAPYRGREPIQLKLAPGDGACLTLTGPK